MIGTGSLSFDLVKSLTDRLPVLLCPRWLTTPTQPIAVDDVLAYLMAGKDLPPGESRIFEVGSPDVTTYGGMIREYARQKGLRRWLRSLPVLTPYLSSLWLALVTPTAFEVGRHLIEGLKNPTVVQDRIALDVFPIKPMGIRRRSRKVSSAEMILPSFKQHNPRRSLPVHRRDRPCAPSAIDTHTKYGPWATASAPADPATTHQMIVTHTIRMSTQASRHVPQAGEDRHEQEIGDQIDDEREGDPPADLASRRPARRRTRS